ncbi:MAG TPA: RHS repeat-associated core domain-containing protein, partial [Pirellulaceae bacterium]|nr:RHS repeat-associated core domain-containing protein [Pirellulaceae bacterium]
RYSYDPTERLSEATRADGGVETFSFDPAGNLSRRGTTGLAYERGNRLSQRGADQIEHDAWGNVVAVASPAGTSRFEYDIDQRLVAHVAPDGRRTEYQYDALGRRRAKTGPDGTTEFVWDRHVLMAEVAGGSHREYLFEPDSFRPLARFGEDGFEVYHVDHLGTPRELTDESGQVVWSARYDAYGRARVERAERDNPLRFPGQYEDVESGLHYNYHRYYDPDAGRYFTQDPLGLNAGTNFYRYVQNPINWDDPFGLFDEFEIARMGASGHKGDGLDAHELLQSAWLKENHPGYSGRYSGMGRDNPAIALSDAIHDDISAAQRAASLHDAATLSGQTALQNINANAKILEQNMIAHGVDPTEAREIVRDMKKQARAFGKMYGVKGC